jgi:hypothetical protein
MTIDLLRSFDAPKSKAGNMPSPVSERRAIFPQEKRSQELAAQTTAASLFLADQFAERLGCSKRAISDCGEK